MASIICWKLFFTFIALSVGSFLVIMCFEIKPLSEKCNQIFETVSEIALIIGFIVLIFAIWFY